ncbi:hypothetical protein [Sphingomonas sp. 10B4]|uniref:hypothetical protein n=1 Tax=Sphingomonas sp. 10B4 TaxID=3048575 RepID=UPI002AB5BC0C|nr:hypothetical protein [Sphingomonas sp. 10B4]MDY7524627.1 hypothetical protein [Sphingomonas sp. 10B4]MEB0282417.1 hypothetical protein [Sphingomonas sp. 10B4]
MTDVWNNVTIYGPRDDIERFKRECLEPDEQVYRGGQSGWDGCACTISLPPPDDVEGAPPSSSGYLDYVWNFQQFKSASTVRYSFSFDSDGEFPVQTFEQLAASFPRLAFDCTCIEALDEFMGYGWFNAPPGGEGFRQDFKVPKDYWTGGGGEKRSLKAQAAHEARVAGLEKAAIECG